MKVRYKPTGGIWESNNELTVDQWKKRPDLYEKLPEQESERPAHTRKTAK